MSNTTDKMLDRYVYLHLPGVTVGDIPTGLTIHVKLDDEGVAVDAWQEDEVIVGTWKTYSEMGVEVKEIKEGG
jgi:hypothetical protein